MCGLVKQRENVHHVKRYLSQLRTNWQIYRAQCNTKQICLCLEMCTVLLEQCSALEKETDLSTGLISLSSDATLIRQLYFNNSQLRNLCSVTLDANPLIPLLRLNSKSDSIFWKNTSFSSWSHFKEVFQKPLPAVWNVLQHLSLNSTCHVGKFGYQRHTISSSDRNT